MNFKKKIVFNLVIVLFFLPQTSFAAIYNTASVSGKSVGSRLNIAEFNTIVEAVKSFFRDDSNGNVGIGTSTPSSTLDVEGTVTATAFVGDGTGLTGLGTGKFVDGDNPLDAVYESGNVGVGTSTPSTELEVLGTATATEFVGGGAGLTGIDSTAIATNAIQDSEIDYTQVTLMDFTNDAGFITSGFINDLSTATLACTAGQVAKYNGSAWECAADENAGAWTDNAGDIYFNSGNVGIGETSPTEALSVVGDVRVDTDTLFVDSTNDRVGVGLTTPSTALEVAGTVTATAFSGDGSGLTGLLTGKFVDGASADDAVYTTGNVGVGVTAPSTALEVVGTVTATAFVGDGSGLTGVSGKFVDGTDTNDAVYTTGNVGVGTSTPNEALTVEGVVSLNEVDADPSVSAGYAKLFARANSAVSGVDSNTKLMIHSDDSDGSTTFVDSSSFAQGITASGGAHHEVDQQKFGTTSIYFDGIDDYIDVASSAEFAFGDGDFTIDFWYNPTSFNTNQYLFDLGSNGGTVSMESGKLRFYNPTIGVGSTLYTNGPTLLVDNWYHVAIVRNSGTTTGYVNGTSYASAADAMSYPTATLHLARYGGGGFVTNGYMDEVRVSAGIARWTTNFTPPT
ncbi:MAG: LamG domain-containing protein, partial [Candidatus Peregrinibacteria bacterium]|nr:LamG domain-containing protein [Candidatus Peregrinibacteria bacterium]